MQTLSVVQVTANRSVLLVYPWFLVGPYILWNTSFMNSFNPSVIWLTEGNNGKNDCIKIHFICKSNWKPSRMPGRTMEKKRKEVKDTFELKLFHHDQQNNIIDIHLYGRLDKLKVSNKRMKIFMFYLISPCFTFFECYNFIILFCRTFYISNWGKEREELVWGMTKWARLLIWKWFKWKFMFIRSSEQQQEILHDNREMGL